MKKNFSQTKAAALITEVTVKPELSEAARNIIAVYLQATPEIRAGQRDWYPRAKAEAERLAAAYGVTVEVASAVIAALSPANLWSKNLKDAEILLSGYAAGIDPLEVRRPNGKRIGMKAFVGKAAKILEGADILSTLKGLKIQAFHRNIMGDRNAVTVDGHAVNIARHGTQRVSIMKAGKVSPKAYREAALAYAEAAKWAGISPSEMQAITWVAYRELTFKIDR